jgi:hypothetical protein
MIKDLGGNKNMSFLSEEDETRKKNVEWELMKEKVLQFICRCFSTAANVGPRY